MHVLVHVVLTCGVSAKRFVHATQIQVHQIDAVLPGKAPTASVFLYRAYACAPGHLLLY